MIFSIIGIALISVSICVILQRTNPEFSMLISLTASALIFLIIFLNLKPVIDAINKYVNDFNLNNVYITTILKSLGICYLTQIASETCKDCGFNSIASKVELAGKIAIVLLTLPMLESLIKTIEKLIYLK